MQDNFDIYKLQIIPDNGRSVLMVKGPRNLWSVGEIIVSDDEIRSIFGPHHHDPEQPWLDSDERKIHDSVLDAFSHLSREWAKWVNKGYDTSMF